MDDTVKPEQADFCWRMFMNKPLQFPTTSQTLNEKPVLNIQSRSTRFINNNNRKTPIHVLGPSLWKCSLVGNWGASRTRGGGGTPLYDLYGDVPLDKVWFFGLSSWTEYLILCESVLNRVWTNVSPCLKWHGHMFVVVKYGLYTIQQSWIVCLCILSFVLNRDLKWRVLS